VIIFDQVEASAIYGKDIKRAVRSTTKDDGVWSIVLDTDRRVTVYGSPTLGALGKAIDLLNSAEHGRTGKGTARGVASRGRIKRV
jgi:hypothetical protein